MKTKINAIDRKLVVENYVYLMVDIIVISIVGLVVFDHCLMGIHTLGGQFEIWSIQNSNLVW